MTVPDTITIDGPAGAGKSTLGELLAHRLGYLYFDTGVMYRALTWAALGQNIDPGDEPAAARCHARRGTRLCARSYARGSGRSACAARL